MKDLQARLEAKRGKLKAEHNEVELTHLVVELAEAWEAMPCEIDAISSTKYIHSQTCTKCKALQALEEYLK